MKKIDRYITYSFVKGFLMSLIMFISIFLLVDSFKITGWILDGKFNIKEALKYTRYGMPETLVRSIPLGILLGSLLTISKMAKQLEIISLKTSGISFKRIIRYPIIISMLISIFVLYISSELLPNYIEKRRFLEESIDKNKQQKIIEKSNVYLRISPKEYIYFEHISKQTNTGENILLIELKDNLNDVKTIYTIDSSNYDSKNNIWIFNNVTEYDVDSNESKKHLYLNKELNVNIDDILVDQFVVTELTFKELREKAVYSKRVGADTESLFSEFYNRISFSFAAFIMSFIGLSLGSKYVRTGSAMNIGISVLIGYSYYGIQRAFVTLGNYTDLPLFIISWIPNILFLSLGIYFMYKAEY